MNIRKLFGVVTLIALTAFPALSSAQAHLPDVGRRLKIHKKRLPRPSHRSLVVHPRRLAIQQGKHRRQYRFLSKKQNHTVRKNVRTVTHKVTKPHHPRKN